MREAGVTIRRLGANDAAEHLYRSCGFEEWGRERRAVIAQGTNVTKIHMEGMLDS